MLFRVVLALLLSTLISLTLIFGLLMGEWQYPLELIIMVPLYGLLFSPIILIYGVLSFYIAEFFSRKWKSPIQVASKAIVLILLAVVAKFILPSDAHIIFMNIELEMTLITAISIAIIASIIDELLKSKCKWFNGKLVENN
ncbi:hypothetical protein [Bacillus ndiopicus]|uniref:hypothetical protein n=1 Tax=Bacillus ndiopicus TaxID=1347368 RepID=UPI0005A8E49E|nr:hypothetical protein [Bacillus ndiopicus]